MEQSRLALLELTRCGLWGGEVNLALFEGDFSWPMLIKLAKQQTLLGVISPVVETLPESLRPARETLLAIHQFVSKNRLHRAHHLKVLRELYPLLKRAGVEKPILLKGIGVGLNYPDPTLRQCGDIDIYIGSKNFDSVFNFLCKELNLVADKGDCGHHFTFDFMGASIELHWYVVQPSTIPFARKEFMQWTQDQLEGDDIRTVEIDGVEIYLPPYNFDYIFVFLHTIHHLLIGGVGLRQFCDWCCYVDTFQDKFDYIELSRLIKLFGLERVFMMFSTLAVDNLGLDSKCVVNYTRFDEKIVRQVFEVIWQGGNFGVYYNDKLASSETILERKLKTLKKIVRNTGLICRVDCRYSTMFYACFICDRAAVAMLGISKLTKRPK